MLPSSSSSLNATWVIPRCKGFVRGPVGERNLKVTLSELWGAEAVPDRSNSVGAPEEAAISSRRNASQARL